MRQIVENRYVRAFSFSSVVELSTFVNNQNVIDTLSLENSLDEYYYCYVCYHSLTKDRKFVISFSSNEKQDDLNFLFWGNSLVLDTGENIYLIDKEMNVKASFEITVPIIGLYVINEERILLLEEVYVRVINRYGEIVKSDLLDLVEDFDIIDNMLSIKTGDGLKMINLTK